MTTLFVTRHPGAKDWIEAQGLTIDRIVDHLDPESVRPGDTVIGSLPVNLAARLCERGGRYLHLSLELPRELRGLELDAATMDRHGARLEGYRVHPLSATDTDPQPLEGAIQVCVLSGQLLANVIPALLLRPCKVYALVSDAMQTQGKRFQWLLEREGIDCQLRPGLPTDHRHLSRWAEDLATDLGKCHPDTPIAFNATGGIKLMTLALLNALQTRLPKTAAFYADTQNKVLVRLDAPDHPLDMDDVLDL